MNGWMLRLPQGYPSLAVECLTHGLPSDACGLPSIRLGRPVMNSSQMPLCSTRGGWAQSCTTRGPWSWT